MQCYRCGRKLDAEGNCAFCDHKEPEVRVMSSDEKKNYQGITLEETSDGEVFTEQEAAEKKQRQSHIFIKHVSLGGNWASKIALLLLIAAIVGFVIFIALPVAMIGLVMGIVVWLILSFLRG